MAKKELIVNVQPLRTKEEIAEMLFAVKRGNKGNPKRKALAERDVMLFLLGINTGLRVGDLVKLKVGDVKGKDKFIIYEGKTNKRRVVNIKMLREELDEFTKDKKDHEYLFKSQKGENRPLSTTQVYRILQDAGKLLGRDDIGTHTMRKTFGYHHYKKYKDVAVLQDILNHSSPSITMNYIGIRQEEIDETLDDFRLG